MFLFNVATICIAMLIVVLYPFISKKPVKTIIHIQCFFLGIELWASTNAILLIIFGGQL